MIRRRVLGLIAGLCLVTAGLGGCTPGSQTPATSSATTWDDAELSEQALAYLSDKYGQEFVILGIKWDTSVVQINAEASLTARPASDDSPLAQFNIEFSADAGNKTPAMSPFRDDYVGVRMAPYYEALIEPYLAGLFGQYRLIVWVTGFDQYVPADVTPEAFMDRAFGAFASVGILIGAAVPEGTTAENLQPTLVTIHDRLRSNLPAWYVNLRVQGFTAGQEYEERITQAENGPWAQALASDHNFGDGGVLVFTSWDGPAGWESTPSPSGQPT